MTDNNTNKFKSIFCRNCGKEIPSDSMFCPVCGKNVATTHNSDNNKSSTSSKEIKGKVNALINKIQPKYRLAISLALIVVAIICVIIGITTFTSEDFSFYKNHYEDCIDGYEDCMEKSKSEGWYFSSSYESIADSYKEMADRDLSKIIGFSISAIILFVLSGVLIVASYLFFPSKKTTIEEKKTSGEITDTNTGEST